MENNEAPKKEMYDENEGFTFMQKWPAVVRWILVLPIALFSFILVNGFSNWALKITDAAWFLYAVSFVFHTIATGIFIFNGTATAPSGRKVVKIILAAIMLLSAIVIFSLPQEKYTYADLSSTLKIINFVSVVLGIAWVFFASKKKEKV